MIAPDAIVPDDELVLRLRFMFVRLGRDPKLSLDIQVALGQMTEKHAAQVLALYKRTYVDFVRADGRPDWAAVGEDVQLHQRGAL